MYHSGQLNYLVHLQYLGYAYHGWAVQPNVKTVQGTIEKVLGYVLEDDSFKVLGASRTDAQVSANHMALQLTTRQEIKEDFIGNMNLHLPPDIRFLEFEQVEESFNIIKATRFKEYKYCFSYGQRFHPFECVNRAWFHDHLDMVKMQEGALVFRGKHDFQEYTKITGKKKDTIREIFKSEITVSDERSDVVLYHVHGPGFMQHQVRMMVGALILLGRGELHLDDIKKSLSGKALPVKLNAPAAGLILNKIHF